MELWRKTSEKNNDKARRKKISKQMAYWIYKIANEYKIIIDGKSISNIKNVSGKQKLKIK